MAVSKLFDFDFAWGFGELTHHIVEALKVVTADTPLWSFEDRPKLHESTFVLFAGSASEENISVAIIGPLQVGYYVRPAPHFVLAGTGIDD